MSPNQKTDLFIEGQVAITHVLSFDLMWLSSRMVTGIIMVVSQNVLLPDRLRPGMIRLLVVTKHHPSDLVA